MLPAGYRLHTPKDPGKSFTYSLPVQKLDASLANHAMTPRSSSGRPMRPKGFKFDHLSRRWGCASRYAAVMLSHGIIFVSVRVQKNAAWTYDVYMCPGDSELTRIFSGPSSQAMLRAIWRTADLLVLYDTHAWSYAKLLNCPVVDETRLDCAPCS